MQVMPLLAKALKTSESSLSKTLVRRPALPVEDARRRVYILTRGACARRRMMVFINCLVDNPEFDAQVLENARVWHRMYVVVAGEAVGVVAMGAYVWTWRRLCLSRTCRAQAKEALTTPVRMMGGECVISSSLAQAVVKLPSFLNLVQTDKQGKDSTKLKSEVRMAAAGGVRGAVIVKGRIAVSAGVERGVARQPRRDEAGGRGVGGDAAGGQVYAHSHRRRLGKGFGGGRAGGAPHPPVSPPCSTPPDSTPGSTSAPRGSLQPHVIYQRTQA